ncbi:MAG: hypothetical protein HYV04_03830 [Deltaproteobacteria bacterium]|nr:hypothetical protein [Deltaproteobacteria bacterium]
MKSVVPFDSLPGREFSKVVALSFERHFQKGDASGFIVFLGPQGRVT